MKKLDYTALDSAIIAALQVSRMRFPELIGLSQIRQAVDKLAAELKANDPGSYKDDWRFLDTRLQTLRKAGKIRYVKVPSGWELVP